MADAPQTERPLIPAGGKRDLKCKNDQCFVDDVQVVSRSGGRPMLSPTCPHCTGPLEAQGSVYVPAQASSVRECACSHPAGYHEAIHDLFLAMGRPDLVRRLVGGNGGL